MSEPADPAAGAVLAEGVPVVRVNGVALGGTRTDIRMPASLGLDEHSQRIQTHTHSSNADAEVERVVPLAFRADPADHAVACVLLASRRDGRVMTGVVVNTDARLGIRGVRRVHSGDKLRERLLGTP